MSAVAVGDVVRTHGGRVAHIVAEVRERGPGWRPRIGAVCGFDLYDPRPAEGIRLCPGCGRAS